MLLQQEISPFQRGNYAGLRRDMQGGATRSNNQGTVPYYLIFLSRLVNSFALEAVVVFKEGTIQADTFTNILVIASNMA